MPRVSQGQAGARIMKPELIAAMVVSNLNDDLRKKPWRGHPNPLAGHCYVASEALFHLLGGRERGWRARTVRFHGANHWFLEHPALGILDVTAAQYDDPVPYHESRGRGFLTTQPSKRAREVIERVKEKAQ